VIPLDKKLEKDISHRTSELTTDMEINLPTGTVESLFLYYN